ncbi:GntR family transcriptional regulator [Rhizobiaceae bacterium n13]|uniref:GntR family transcriptional regulator n=1 Tax=Ferirhizobium litorale TaxID=2927786 RepID=A0AAE3U397_9HYPH|nr:GntR family transcriptional regulator [Fererhizobium litorale]MDI7862720.1 GntR family transcriptional regulator [Fererhizobium litorale]MDI7924416.1 GntR family transcriptional regulator [Fererhizobium litorale]
MAKSDTFKIKKVQKLSAETQTADALRDGIASGEIPPGTRLTEIRMAEQMGVSRATIRTAFHQLVQEGLIDQIPYTGWAVISLSAHDSWELYTLRSSLEALGSKLVAAKMADTNQSAALKSKLDAVFDALKEACLSGNRKKIADADFALHRAIIDLSGHRRLAEQYSRVEQQIRLYIASSDSLVAEPEIIIEQHRPIIEALQAGDVARSVSAAMEHNEQEGAKLEQHLRRLERGS